MNWSCPRDLFSSAEKKIHGYRETKEHPPIHYFDLELEVDFKLADTFDEFVEKLYTAEDVMSK